MIPVRPIILTSTGPIFTKFTRLIVIFFDPSRGVVMATNCCLFNQRVVFRHAVSRVCAVAQYAVLEANAKVNGRGPFSHPTPPKPFDQFRCDVKYITTSPQAVDVQNLVGIDSAVTDLHMCEKNTFCVDFLINIISIYLSVCLSVYPFLLCGCRSQFWGRYLRLVAQTT